MNAPVVSLLILTIVAPPGVNASVINRMMAEANAIWAPAGLMLAWNRATPDDDIRGYRIAVTIDLARPKETGTDVAVGWIVFKAGSPQPSIHLSEGAAEALMDFEPDRNGTRIEHEMLLGRALGRALSHEIGHYVFRSRTHTRHGLMRAPRPPGDFFSVDRRRFELTPTDGRPLEQQLD